MHSKNASHNIIKQLISNKKPNFMCSFVEHKKCASYTELRDLFTIQLYDNLKYSVNNLKIIYKHRTEEKCAGKGNTTKTHFYCKTHFCEPTGTRYCFFLSFLLIMYVTNLQKLLCIH